MAQKPQQTEPEQQAEEQTQTEQPKVNRYKATEDLFVGRARAVQKGDTFHATQESVENRGWEKQVKKL